MTTETIIATTTDDPPASRPPAIDPSPGVRVVKELRELATDLGAMALAAFFVQFHSLNVLYALGFVLVVLLPQSVLSRYIKLVLARGGAGAGGAAAAMVGAGITLAHVKTGVVVGGAVLTLASCAGVL